MLPGKDGFAVASELRAAGQFVPILMLTARGRPEDVLRGFESGADDYLPKPFELAILLARVSGLLRRRRWNERDAEDAGCAERTRIRSPAGRSTSARWRSGRSGKSHRLTQMECELLRYLVRNAGQVISRGTILEDVWGLHESTDTRAIDNFIVRLRRISRIGRRPPSSCSPSAASATSSSGRNDCSDVRWPGSPGRSRARLRQLPDGRTARLPSSAQ